MSLHPIRALDHVLGEYRDYLQSEFRAKDPGLRAALERELDATGFLAQEPFYQAHRPFRVGRTWRELPLDARLASVMETRSRTSSAYLHQSQAIEELLSSDPHPVVVTTGTGSGKTEAFLLPVIQNAFDDSTTLRRSGLTAILVYPMNALANDQKLRIEDYLGSSGLAGAIRVEQYDRATPQAKRQEMRDNPPHILLTNYMMLEYLLVRPADRENIFANHRCRFLVLDEVHTYRGTLGSNIALLVRRLRVHLARARQNWRPDVPDSERPRRYPELIPVGTSATIRSVAEEGLTRAEIVHQRDVAVQQFFGSLVGVESDSIRVFGEELQDLSVPGDAVYPIHPGRVDADSVDVSDADAVAAALRQLTVTTATTPINEVASTYRLLWDLNAWLIRQPMSLSQIAQRVRHDVSARSSATDDELYAEVESALTIGAALADGIPGVLRLRAHRFIRGGWKFHRCLNPDCGRVYPMGEEQCSSCNYRTAPLYLCRNCGADYLRLAGDPDNEPLRPSADESESPEWMMYEPSRFDLPPIADDDADDSGGMNLGNARRGRQQVPAQIRQSPVLDGSFDPISLQFSSRPDDYRLRVTLVPARTRCLCCGGTAGSRNVITSVALGTSAAVKVIGEGLVEALASANRDREGHDGKERLLIFSDSRQDAAHQARFIIFSSRYDRLRRRLLERLRVEPVLAIQRAVELLGESGVTNRDNPCLPDQTDWIPDEDRNRMQAWEEAPLLDEIAVNAGYRATLVNLGLVGIRYHRLDEYVQARGAELAQALGVSVPQLEHICRVLLDEMRTRGALSRPLLQYHPIHVAYPSHFRSAEWERRLKQPQGYALTPGGEVTANLDAAIIPSGIKHHNAWRRPGVGGRGPSLQRVLEHLLNRFGGNQPDDHVMVDLLEFLFRGRFVVAAELFGARDRYRLLQVNSEVVRLELLSDGTRRHCEVCGDVRAGNVRGLPCPRCHGMLVAWPEAQVSQNRAVRRLQSPLWIPLVAGEHTAQITTGDRAKLEEDFKASPALSPVNVLACSPTLEMGIDVGGLDAVVMRNVPPRPDNYAQRGGRAGRRSRVGIVLGYARRTPHDQYFFDKPREMIAGEVPAPALSLGNRDVLVRHLFAIAFGAADPGLAGRMVDYVAPDGQVKEEAVTGLIEAIQQQSEHAVAIAREAWGSDVLQRAGLDDDQLRACLARLPERIRYVIDCTARQVIELRQALNSYAQSLEGRYAGMRAGELVARLLGLPPDSHRNQNDADDRSAGYPLRRFAEFGLLPGYEFPTEPSSLRLLGDPHEEDPITVVRRFGIGQFQPDANVYARRKRWKVIGLDTASPWNPRSQAPTWTYRLCGSCQLRFDGGEPRCPRCATASPGQVLPAYDFAGFLAKPDERPILDEEDRYAVRNLVSEYPQWNGNVAGRWNIAGGWSLRLSRNEEVRWVNEGPPPTAADLQSGIPTLHREAKGWLVCPTCGRMLDPPVPQQNAAGGRRNPARGGGVQNNGGHSESCPNRGAAPLPTAIVATGGAEVLRILVPVPNTTTIDDCRSWGLSLGYALLNGIQHHFMLSAGELDFELEGPWNSTNGASRVGTLSLAFIDPSLGGSGYLDHVAQCMHLVAARAIDHLDHPDCETACYRCLKTYQNQRFHDELVWPQIVSVLEVLSQSAPEVRPLETGDFDDPRPWLEAYAAGVGSPLELRFLRLFEAHGFHPQKQVPVSPIDGERPISVADFALPERRLAIYVDGAAFHLGNNLRRDRFIRDRLRNGNPPWRVEELRARDLRNGEEVVRRLLSDVGH